MKGVPRQTQRERTCERRGPDTLPRMKDHQDLDGTNSFGFLGLEVDLGRSVIQHIDDEVPAEEPESTALYGGQRRRHRARERHALGGRYYSDGGFALAQVSLFETEGEPILFSFALRPSEALDGPDGLASLLDRAHHSPRIHRPGARRPAIGSTTAHPTHPSKASISPPPAQTTKA